MATLRKNQKAKTPTPSLQQCQICKLERQGPETCVELPRLRNKEWRILEDQRLPKQQYFTITKRELLPGDLVIVMLVKTVSPCP